MKKAIRIAMATVLCLTAMATAQTVPQLINYQGYLTDSAGNPLATAEYTLSFKIYDSATGTTAAWGPQSFTGVPVVKGHFNVILGPKDDNDKDIETAFASDKAYLEITVNDAASPILPRQQILSVPYAMRAGNGNPVGTVIASILTPEQFAIATGDNAQPDAKKQWTLADGKDVTGSGYSQITGKNAVPDLRGMFLRGLDTSGNVDPDGGARTVGDPQSEELKKHAHTFDFRPVGSQTQVTHANVFILMDNDGITTTSEAGGSETRPKNTAVNYFIKIN